MPVRYADRKAATVDLRAGKIASFYVVPSDYLATGHIEFLSRRRQLLLDPVGGRSPVRSWLVAGVLAGRVSDAEAGRARRPIAYVSILTLGTRGDFISQRPSDEVARIFVPFAFAFILMLSIFIASSYLIQGLVEEKSNRVIEAPAIERDAERPRRREAAGAGRRWACSNSPSGSPLPPRP